MYDKSIVSMNRKYSDRFHFECYWEYEKFMYLIDLTHFEDGSGRYSNHFFYACNDYHRNWKTAKEISEMVEACSDDTPEYTYNGSTLGKYARMGLMEVDKSVKPHLYTLPVDFFVSNDLRINFHD